MKGGSAVDIIEYAKALYGKSELGAAVCDPGMNVLWKNRYDIPDRLTHSFFDIDTAPASLCFEKETLLKCADGEAARILPFPQNGEVFYLVELYPSLSIHRLICSSDKLRDLEIQNESIRRLITRALTTLTRRSSEAGEELLEKMRQEVTLSVLRALSANVNFGYISRLMSRGTKCSMTNIDVRLEQTLGYIGEVLGASGTELVTHIAPRVIGLCDYYYLEAALLNLVINAHEYAVCADKRVTVTLSLSADKKEYTVCVSDNGTAADIEKIMAASHIGAMCPELDAKERLGLPFTRYYTELIGGRIDFSPSETGGLTVSLTFPCEDGRTITDLCMDYKNRYNNIFDPCFCILAKASDPTVYDIPLDMLRLRPESDER